MGWGGGEAGGGVRGAAKFLSAFLYGLHTVLTCNNSAFHPPSLYKVPTYSTRAGAAPRAPGGACHGAGNRAVTSQPGTGQSTSYGDVKPSYRGGRRVGQEGVRDMGTQERHQTGGGEQHRHTERGSHTRRGKGEHSRQGGGAQQGRRGNQNSGNREPEWSGWQSVRMGGSDNKGDGLASQPLPGARATPAQPASDGGCLPQPRWAVCATGAGAHQGQTSREGEKDIWWTAGTARGGAGHLGLTHTET